MMIPLRIEHLTKRYGDRLAVDDFSLDVQPGTVFGWLGRNGAGKSTTIARMLGLTLQTSGKVTFFGERLSPHTLGRIAYVPEIDALDGSMTVRQHVEFRRRCYPRFDRTLMSESIERFEIEANRTIRRLSKGQRQGVALALAFAQRPELMILDEHRERTARGSRRLRPRRLLARRARTFRCRRQRAARARAHDDCGRSLELRDAERIAGDRLPDAATGGVAESDTCSLKP